MRNGRVAILTMSAGAVIGAIASWRIASPLMGKVTRLEQEIVEEQRRAA